MRYRLTLLLIFSPIIVQAQDWGEIITADDIQGMAFNKISDVLSRLPGINATDNSISIRGSTKVKVLLDGRPINDQLSHYGGVHFDLVNLGNVALIEIVRGKGALQYGDDASAGLILITSKKDVGYGGNIKTWFGNGSTSHVQANGRVQQGQWSTGLSFTHKDTAGFVDNDDHRQNQVGFRSGYGFGQGKIGMTVDYSEEKYGLPGRVEYPSPYYRKEKEFFTISVPVTFNDIIATSFYNKARQENHDSSRNLATFLKVQEFGQDISNKQTTSLGDVEYGCNFRWNRGLSTGFSGQTEQSLSVFGRHGYQFASWPVTISIGFRGNSYSEFARSLDPEFRLGFKQGNWTIGLSYSQANNAPSLSQRYERTPTKIPNPNLGMELAENYNLNWSLTLPIVNLSGAFYHSRLTDKISYVLGSGGEGRYENFGKVTREGAELQISTSPWQHLTVGLNYTWLEATNEDTGKTLTSSPEHRATLELGYRYETLTIIGEVEYKSKQYTRSDNSSSVPEILLANIRVEYGLSDMDLFGEVSNVGDHNYINSIGYQGDPRAWVAGLNYRF